MQDYVKAFSTVRYSTWIEADHIFNIFSLHGHERDKYTESRRVGQIDPKHDCPAESGTVGMYAYIIVTFSCRTKLISFTSLIMFSLFLMHIELL